GRELVGRLACHGSTFSGVGASDQPGAVQSNLDGAFEVAAEQLERGSVLLVDDVVDSRWSLTVIGALLRQAGAGPVFPLVLASASAAEN
ncbi:hypothetical protein NKH21_26505, partial [Mesorhizobium sp. M1329]